MVVVGLRVIDAFVKAHPECTQELAALVRELEAGTWQTPEELRRRYPSAKILDGRTVVFKIRGNKHRLSLQVAYNTQTAAVLAMETHAEYDRRTLR